MKLIVWVEDDLKTLAQSNMLLECASWFRLSAVLSIQTDPEDALLLSAKYDVDRIVFVGTKEACTAFRGEFTTPRGKKVRIMHVSPEKAARLHLQDEKGEQERYELISSLVAP